MSKYESSIMDQVKRSKTPVPDRIKNKPVLRLGLGLFLQAFWDLNSERSVGEITGSIPWSSVVFYCEYHGFEYHESEELLYFVKRLDEAYLSYKAKKK